MKASSLPIGFKSESSPGDEVEVDVLGHLDLSQVDLKLKEKQRLSSTKSKRTLTGPQKSYLLERVSYEKKGGKVTNLLSAVVRSNIVLVVGAITLVKSWAPRKQPSHRS